MTETRWRMRGRMPVPSYALTGDGGGSGTAVAERRSKIRLTPSSDAERNSELSMKTHRLLEIQQTRAGDRQRNFASADMGERLLKIQDTSDARNSAVVDGSKTRPVDGLEIQPVDGRSFAPVGDPPLLRGSDASNSRLVDALKSQAVGKSPTVGDSSQHPDLFDQSKIGSVAELDTGGTLSIAHPDFLARAEIWRLQREGAISLAEASRRSAAIGRSGKSDTVSSLAPPRPRHSRPSPKPSRQYAPAMSTEAARDDRLTPNAKALLQVLRARCGKGRRTAITKGTMGAVMSRSARTIRRYLVDLVRHGYVELEIARTNRGMHAGLVVQLTTKALPFFEEAKGLAAWLAEAPAAALKPFRPFRAVLSPASAGVTVLSPINQSPKDSFRQRLFSEGKQVIGLPPRPS